MQRAWIGVTMICLLAGRVALAGEEIRSPGLRDLRQAARRTAANPLADTGGSQSRRVDSRSRTRRAGR